MAGGGFSLAARFSHVVDVGFPYFSSTYGSYRRQHLRGV